MTVMRLGAMLCALAAATGIAFAQPGSTGGSLGQPGNSVSSGSGGATGPPARTENNQPAAGGLSIAGRWTLTFNCLGRPATVEATFRHTSATTFEGSSIGATSGYTTRIYDGSISGDRVSWTRVTTNQTEGRVMQNAGRLVGDQLLDGTEKGPFWTCSFTGRKL